MFRIYRDVGPDGSGPGHDVGHLGGHGRAWADAADLLGGRRAAHEPDGRPLLLPLARRRPLFREGRMRPLRHHEDPRPGPRRDGEGLPPPRADVRPAPLGRAALRLLPLDRPGRHPQARPDALRRRGRPDRLRRDQRPHLRRELGRPAGRFRRSPRHWGTDPAGRLPLPLLHVSAPRPARTGRVPPLGEALRRQPPPRPLVPLEGQAAHHGPSDLLHATPRRRRPARRWTAPLRRPPRPRPHAGPALHRADQLLHRLRLHAHLWPARGLRVHPDAPKGRPRRHRDRHPPLLRHRGQRDPRARPLHARPRRHLLPRTLRPRRLARLVVAAPRETRRPDRRRLSRRKALRRLPHLHRRRGGFRSHPHPRLLHLAPPDSRVRLQGPQSAAWWLELAGNPSAARLRGLRP